MLIETNKSSLNLSPDAETESDYLIGLLEERFQNLKHLTCKSLLLSFKFLYYSAYVYVCFKYNIILPNTL
jgi:hypothetical protein